IEMHHGSAILSQTDGMKAHAGPRLRLTARRMWSIIIFTHKRSYAHTRWEKSPQGMRGTPIDMGEESRIGFLLELAVAGHSIEFFALGKQVSGRLIAQWGGHVPDFGSVRRLFQKISAQKWVLAHGGQEV